MTFEQFRGFDHFTKFISIRVDATLVTAYKQWPWHINHSFVGVKLECGRIIRAKFDG